MNSNTSLKDIIFKSMKNDIKDSINYMYTEKNIQFLSTMSRRKGDLYHNYSKYDVNYVASEFNKINSEMRKFDYDS